MEIRAATFGQAMRKLASIDLKTAGRWAVNDMAAMIRDDVTDRMEAVFDRPTRFTKNAFMVVRAPSGGEEITATVQRRPTNAQRDYLRVQEEGGPRRQTGFEAQMSRSLAYEGVIQSIIPADNARLDAYGNWSVGERNQVQSALKAQRDSATNMTDASWRKARKRRATYFVPQGGLTPGIYKKDMAGRIGIVAIFSEKVPVYQQRLGFFEHATALFGQHMARLTSEKIARIVASRSRSGASPPLGPSSRSPSRG